MGMRTRRESPNLSSTVESLRRQLKQDRTHTPEEQAQIETARQEWAHEMEQLDAAYQIMLDADPVLRQRLEDKHAVLAALLDAAADDRNER